MTIRFASAVAAAIIAAGAAHAGGFTAPTVDVAPVEPVVIAAEPGDWAGGYAGVTLGYAFGGDDVVGAFAGDTFLGDLGTEELSGANAGIRAGYRWQRNRWVVGPEISYQAGDISDEFDLAAGGTFESQVDSLLAVKLKTGYAVRPDTLVYGIAGWQRGDFTYDVAGVESEYDADGYVVGLGAERKLTDRMSVTGEWEYSDFGNTDVEIAPGVTTTATPKFSNVKLGLNFKF
ncbi:outer membrane protein [Paracoccus luteus]|uniref:outer membrane protein n=1 Tax=Paracoccus luteus TaxID=2508543 RepID=UPI00106F8235|nr:porin family protein [Paracoccus luteus]